MNSDRKSFLATIKTQLENSLLPGAETAHPGSFGEYSYQADAPVGALVQQFQQEFEALAGQFHAVTSAEEVAPLIESIAHRHGATQLLSWAVEDLGLPGLVDGLKKAGLDIIPAALLEGAAQRKAVLAELDGVKIGLTGAAGTLADTGAIALVSGPGRGRLASLLPPVHIALISQQRLYPSLPAFLASHPQATATGSNLVFVAGPSRTGDIEMTLTMGVHGPGEVHAIVMP